MKQLERILQKLIINGTLTEPPGLFFGKTGIVIFFLHYARQTGNTLYRNYAMDLIEMIQSQIAGLSYVRYDVGIAGIGAGFEYLLQNRLLEAEDDDIFEELDDRMCRAAMYEPYPNLNLPEGLTGWGRYFIYRMHGNGHKTKKLHEVLVYIASEITKKIEDKIVLEHEMPDVYRFLYDLTNVPGYEDKYSNVLQKCREWKCITELNTQKVFPYLGALQRLYTCQKYFAVDLSNEIGQKWETWKETNHHTSNDMGLLNGLTSDALLHLTFFHKHAVSWINLL